MNDKILLPELFITGKAVYSVSFQTLKQFVLTTRKAGIQQGDIICSLVFSMYKIILTKWLK